MHSRKRVAGIGVALLIAAPAALAQEGTLVVKAKPKGTGVFVDGKYMGPAGKQGHTLSAGEHEVVLSHPVATDHTTKVRIEAGKTATVEQRMSGLPLANPPFGRLKVTGGADDAAVLVNGRYMGQAREFRGGKLLLNPGQYLVETMARGGGLTHREKITITEKQITTVLVR